MTEPADPTTGRRAFLLAGAAAGSAALAGCGGLPFGPSSPTERESPRTAASPAGDTPGGPAVTEPARPGPLRFADRFERSVDLSRVGADLAGNEPIGGLLREHAADNTMLYFPRGRYYLEDPWAFVDFSNFGLVGDEAVIVPEDGAHETFIGLGEAGRAEGLVLSGLTFDFRADRTGGRPVEVRVDDGLLVDGLRVVGRQDVEHDLLRFDVTGEDGRGVVRRLDLRDGGVSKYRITGAYVGDTSRGTITFEDCRIEGFPDNGLYASSAVGPVRVIGGYYANNGISNVRVGGRGLVRGVHVRCDDASRGFSNMRGIRLDNGGTARIEDCDVEMLQVTDSNGALTLSPWMASAVVRNTRIQVDADRVDAIWAKQPADGLEGEPSLDVRDVDVVGSAAGGPTVQVDGRDNTRLVRLRVRQTGEDRDGILLQRSENNLIQDTSIDVTGVPLRLEDATAQTRNVVTNGTSRGSSRPAGSRR